MSSKKLFKIHALTSLFLIVLSALSTRVNAQSWQWAIRGGSNQHVSGHTEATISVKVDEEGNSFMLAAVSSTNLDVDGIQLDPIGPREYLISSFDCDGNHRWSRLIASSGSKHMNRIELDAEGNVYTAFHAYRSGDVHIKTELGVSDTVIIETPNNTTDTLEQTLFLARFSNDGDLDWLRSPQPDNIDLLSSIRAKNTDFTIDDEGIIHWMCQITPGVYGSSSSTNPYVNSDTGYTMHILKYDLQGNFLGGHPMAVVGGNYGGIPYSIMKYSAVHKQYYFVGNVYVSLPAAIIDGDTMVNSMFMAAFNENGDLVWKRENTEDVVSKINGLEIDSLGFIYVSGTIANHDTFANETFVVDSVSSAFSQFIFKFNSAGEFVWHQTSSRIGGPGIYGVTVAGEEVAVVGRENGITWDGVDSIYSSGSADLYFARFNRYTGQPLGMENIESSSGGLQVGYAITSTRRNDYFIGGRLHQQIYVAGDTLVAKSGGSGLDFVMAKFGDDDCDCELPEADFLAESSDTTTFDFTYLGSPYNSITWDFGDGSYSTDNNPVHSYSFNGEHKVCVVVTNDCGYDEHCMYLDSVEMDTTVVDTGVVDTGVVDGLDEFNRIMDVMSVYPNPVSNEFQVKTNHPQQMNYIIYNVVGREVLSGVMSTENQKVNVEQLTSGWYVVSLENQEGERYKISFIKQ